MVKSQLGTCSTFHEILHDHSSHCINVNNLNGYFGFLSKAHNDQNLVSGDVQSKIAIFDEKIKTARENIEADRKQLKQMDEAVDQIMARSTTEGGADKANAVRKSQQRDRVALAKDIESQQKLIASLNDEAAPIRAEVRKVDAEVGPIKYIAAFIYGTAPDASMLERAVTWIIILIVIVFDPLAVIMLLAAQMTFGWAREQKEDIPTIAELDMFVGEKPTDAELEQMTDPEYEQDDGPLAEQQIEDLKKSVKLSDPGEHPADTLQYEESELEKWNKMIEEAEREATKDETETTLEERLATGETYINSNGEETSAEESTVEPAIEEIAEESKKKTYMIKDPTGQIQIKNKE